MSGPRFPTADRWKAEQRDWLLPQLGALIVNWEIEAENKDTVFCADPDHDRTAKARTGACAKQLRELLNGIG